MIDNDRDWWHCENSAAELLEDIVKNAQPAEMQEVLLLVAQLFASQPQLTSFPDKPLKVCLIGIVSVPLWPGCFSSCVPGVVASTATTSGPSASFSCVR